MDGAPFLHAYACFIPFFLLLLRRRHTTSLYFYFEGLVVIDCFHPLGLFRPT